LTRPVHRDPFSAKPAVGKSTAEPLPEDGQKIVNENRMRKRANPTNHRRLRIMTTGPACPHPWEALQWDQATGEVVCSRCGQTLDENQVVELEGQHLKLKDTTRSVLAMIREIDADVQAKLKNKEELAAAAGILAGRKCKYCGHSLPYEKLARGGRPREVCDRCTRARIRGTTAEWRKNHLDETRGKGFARVLGSGDTALQPNQ
jgi:hypothetical protein